MSAIVNRKISVQIIPRMSFKLPSMISINIARKWSEQGREIGLIIVKWAKGKTLDLQGRCSSV